MPAPDPTPPAPADEPRLGDAAFDRQLRGAAFAPAVSLALLALALLALVAFLVVGQRWVEHTQRVLALSYRAEKLLLDLQTSARAYYATDDPAYLAPYRASAPRVPEVFEELGQTVTDPGQRAELRKLARDADAWLAFLDASLGDAVETPVVPLPDQPATGSAPTILPPVDRDDDEGAEANAPVRLQPATQTARANTSVATKLREGKLRFDAVRAGFDAFIAREEEFLDRRAARARRTTWWALGLGALATVLVAVWQCRGVVARLRDISGVYRAALRASRERRAQVAELLRQIDSELKAVGEIQKSLLPIALPAVPGLRIAASYQTSQRAGGDYYDFFRLPMTGEPKPGQGARYGILIADVSGHGTPAAVLMAVTHSIAHGFEQPDTPPSHLLAFVNRRLSRGYTSQHTAFVTAFYAIFDPRLRTLQYSSAGHNPPRLRRAHTSEFVELEDARGLPLGVLEDADYESATVQLAPGDTLVLYTDGITEARPAGRDPALPTTEADFFGEQNLDDAIAAAEPQEPHAMLKVALERVRAFAGDEVGDDRTLLVLQVADDDQPHQPLVNTETVVSESPDQLGDLRRAVEADVRADASANGDGVAADRAAS